MGLLATIADAIRGTRGTDTAESSAALNAAPAPSYDPAQSSFAASNPAPLSLTGANTPPFVAPTATASSGNGGGTSGGSQAAPVVTGDKTIDAMINQKVGKMALETVKTKKSRVQEELDQEYQQDIRG